MTEITRRTFIQLTVLGGAAAYAGLASGCDNPEEARGQYGGYNSRLRPYVNQPEGMTDGVPQWFATTCAMCPAGCGLLVRTMGGRAVKIEGNPEHPVNRGKTCARGQAALQRLYNPGRLRFPAVRSSRDKAAAVAGWDDALAQVAAVLGARRGKVALLLDGAEYEYAPTAMQAIRTFAAAAGAAVYSHALIDDAPWRAAARAVYGRDQIPAYLLDEADVIVSFSGNFLETWPSPVYYGRLYGEFRQDSRRSPGEHGRFIYIGPRMSMTAAKADRWIPCNPGTEGAVALGILNVLGGGGISPAEAASLSGVPEDIIAAIARRMVSAGTRALATGGDGLLGQPGATAALTAVEAINAQVKSRAVGFGEQALRTPRPRTGGIGQFLTAVDAGRVEALLIVGEPNPVFTLPAHGQGAQPPEGRGAQAAQPPEGQGAPGQPTASRVANAADVAAALARVPFIAALTPFEDETTSRADILLPTRTFLESSGDRVPSVLPAGFATACLQQPIIDPKFVRTQGPGRPPRQWMDTRPLTQILTGLSERIGAPQPEAAAAQQPSDAAQQSSETAGTTVAPSAAVGTTGATAAEVPISPNGTTGQGGANALPGWPAPQWRDALGRGGIWTPRAAAPVTGRPPAGLAFEGPSTPPAPGTFALLLYPHLYWTDGRHANLPWLQEIPDPMTMAVWNSWVEINAGIAHELNIRTGDIVRVTTAFGSIEAPAVPYPGMHPAAVAMPIGQGHAARYAPYAQDARHPEWDPSAGQTAPSAAAGRGGYGVNPLSIAGAGADPATGSLTYSGTPARITKVKSAQTGYWPDSLVVLEDRPRGQEPEAVKDLIHTTAREWRDAKAAGGTQ